MEKTLSKERKTFPHYELSGLDRCDRCRAQAFIVAHKKIDGVDRVLLFCGHHGRQFLPQLGISGWAIQDEFSKIDY